MGQRWWVVVLVLLVCQARLPSAPGDELELDPARVSREAAFDELARDVAALEQQGSVLKRVARLVKPTVVHIEALRDTEDGRPLHAKPADEAGSGVIIQRRGKHLRPARNRSLADLLPAQSPEERCSRPPPRVRPFALPPQIVHGFDAQTFQQIALAGTPGTPRVEWAAQVDFVRLSRDPVEITPFTLAK